MKNIFRYFAIAALALGSCMAVTSCSDDTDAKKDKGAQPVIKYARSCDINAADSLITKASLGSHLCFVGDNLGDVQQVWFNDQKCKLNPTMVTSHTIILDIPNVIPGEVTNIAKFITSTGLTTEFPFEVVVPGPRINTMNLEYATPGMEVTLNGAYFVDDPNVPMTVTFPSNLDAEIRSFTQTEMTVVVPDGATIEGPISVTTIYGTGETPFHFLDTRGIMFDFDADGLTGLGMGAQCWHARPTRNDGDGISGDYMVLGDGSTPLSANGDWDDSNYSFEYWAGAWTDPVTYPEREGVRLYDIVDFSDFENMIFKFEMLIPSSNPWQAGAMQIIFAGTDKVSLGNAGVDIYGNTVAGCNNTYFQEESLPRALYRPWTDSSAYHTDGEWVTVRVPLSEFLYTQDGGTSSGHLEQSSFASLQMFVWAGGVTGVECTPVIKIDNIRCVTE